MSLRWGRPRVRPFRVLGEPKYADTPLGNEAGLVLADPMLPIEALYGYAEHYPWEVLKNPVLDLYAMDLFLMWTVRAIRQRAGRAIAYEKLFFWRDTTKFFPAHRVIRELGGRTCRYGYGPGENRLWRRQVSKMRRQAARQALRAELEAR